MMNFLKKNWVTVLIVVATVILAGIAIYTAIRLYQLRQTTVAPNAPSSQPAAYDYGTNCASLGDQASCQAADCKWNINRNRCSAGNGCLISFSLLTTATTTPTPTATATASSSPSPSPTTPPACNTSCSADIDCPSGMTCTTDGQCRTTSCTSEVDCICATATPTATPTTTPTPTPAVPLSCGDSCTSNADCANNMVCVSSGVCRNPSCLNSTNCICETATPAGTSSAPPLAQGGTPAPSLPESGTSTPAIVGAAAGILLLLGAFILAL